jgi:drug/metabolite transporter (DMT)-like permease
MIRRRTAPSSYAIAFASVASGALGQVMLKSGTGHSTASGLVETLARAFSTPLVWVGLASYAFSSLLWLVALSRMDLSAAYPLGASGYVVVAVASLLMGETVSLWRWIGVAAIVAGILLVSVGRPAPAEDEGGDR